MCTNCIMDVANLELPEGGVSIINPQKTKPVPWGVLCNHWTYGGDEKEKHVSVFGGVGDESDFTTPELLPSTETTEPNMPNKNFFD